MQRRIDIIKSQLLEHLNQANEDGLRNLFEVTHPSDLGSVLESIDLALARELFQLMPSEKKVEILGEVAPGRAAEFLQDIEDQQYVDLLGQLNPDDSADISLTLDSSQQERLLGSIGDEEFRRTLIDLISYPSDSAGGIMTTEYLAVPEEYTVQDAIEAARSQAQDAEIIYYIYTMDEDKRLSGVLSLRRLLQAPADTPVGTLTERDLIKVRVESDQEAAAKIMDRYGLLAIPVVDHQDQMRGIITTDDAVDILEQEATEDIYKQAGISPFEEIEQERSVKVTQSSLWTNLSVRIPWLVVVCFGTLLTASTISLFEGYLQQFVELAFFMPVIAAMGGNVGAQSTTIFVRGLVLGELDTRSFWRPFFSELYKTGLGIGLFFGLFLGLAAWCWQFYLRGTAPTGYALHFGLAVGVSMFLSIVLASANGFLIPWLVSVFGADPAAASNPLLTTVQDTVGIVIYFSCAAVFLTQF